MLIKLKLVCGREIVYRDSFVEAAEDCDQVADVKHPLVLTAESVSVKSFNGHVECQEVHWKYHNLEIWLAGLRGVFAEELKLSYLKRSERIKLTEKLK